MVTSCNKTALSLQLVDVVISKVCVASGACVNVAGMNPSFVGIRVAVTKFGSEVSSDSTETEMHETRKIGMDSRAISLLLISKHHQLTLGLFNRVAGDLLFERLARQDRDFEQSTQ